jgi:hypothetical protein
MNGISVLACIFDPPANQPEPTVHGAELCRHSCPRSRAMRQGRAALALNESAPPFFLQTHGIMVASAGEAILIKSHKSDPSDLLLHFELIRSTRVIDSNCSN